MEIALPLLCVALAALLAFSGLGKLRSADRGARSFEALRLAVRHPRRVVLSLGVLEVALAIGLCALTGPLLMITAGTVAVMLLGFSIAAARATRLGSTDECGCFGEFGSARVGPRLIVRNAVFTAAAAVLAVATASGADAGVVGAVLDAVHGDADALLVVAVGAVVVLGAVLSVPTGSARQTSSPDASGDDRSGPHDGAVTSSGSALIVLRADRGVVTDLDRDRRGLAQVLAFVKPDCRPCRDVIAELDRRREQFGGHVMVTLLVSGSIGTEASADPAHLGGTRIPIVIDVDDSLARRFGIRQRPSIVLIGADAVPVHPFASGSGESLELISALATATTTAR